MRMTKSPIRNATITLAVGSWSSMSALVVWQIVDDSVPTVGAGLLGLFAILACAAGTFTIAAILLTALPSLYACWRQGVDYGKEFAVPEQHEAPLLELVRD